MGSQNKASLTMMMLYQSTWQGGRDVAIQKPAVVASSWQTRVRETNHQKTDPPAAQAMRQTTSIFSPAGGGYGRFAGQSDGCRQADRALWPQAAVDAGAAVHLLAADKLGSLPDAGRTLREGGVVAGSSVAPTRQGEHLPGIHQGPTPQRQTALEGGGPPARDDAPDVRLSLASRGVVRLCRRWVQDQLPAHQGQRGGLRVRVQEGQDPGQSTHAPAADPDSPARQTDDVSADKRGGGSEAVAEVGPGALRNALGRGNLLPQSQAKAYEAQALLCRPRSGAPGTALGGAGSLGAGIPGREADTGHRQRPLEFQRGLGPAGGASCRRRPRRRLWRSSDTIGQRSQGHLHANRLQTRAQLAADQDDRAAGLAKNHDGERVGNQAGTGVSWHFHRGIVHGVAWHGRLARASALN